MPLSTTRRFQFSLIRLLACTSALCIAAASFTNGFALAIMAKSGFPMLIGWMVGWLMMGAGIGFLLGNRRVVVAFFGAIAAFALICVLGFVFTR